MNQQLRIPWEELRAVDAGEVTRRLGLTKSKGKKHACVACASSDALHVYADVGSKQGRGAYCWSCHTSFTSLDLVMHVLDVDVREAAKILAGWFGIPLDVSYTERLTPRVIHRLDHAGDSGHATLQEIYEGMVLGPRGKRYLESRGLDVDVCQAMGVRSVESWEAWCHLCGEFSPSELHAAGLMGDPEEARPYLHPGKRRFPALVLPYFDRHRKYALDTFRLRPFDEAYQEPKYLSLMGDRGKPSGPFLSSVIEVCEGGELQILEGELNALAMLSSGHHAISGCGNGSWEGHWCFGIKRAARVNIVCDGDHPDPEKPSRDAGRMFGVSVATCLRERYGDDWLTERARAVVCPDGYDANELMQLGAIEYLSWDDEEEVIERAPEWLWARAALDAVTPWHPARCAELVLEQLASIIVDALAECGAPKHIQDGSRNRALTLWSLVHEGCEGLPGGVSALSPFGRLLWYFRTHKHIHPDRAPGKELSHVG